MESTIEYITGPHRAAVVASYGVAEGSAEALRIGQDIREYANLVGRSGAFQCKAREIMTSMDHLRLRNFIVDRIRLRQPAVHLAMRANDPDAVSTDWLIAAIAVWSIPVRPQVFHDLEPPSSTQRASSETVARLVRRRDGFTRVIYMDKTGRKHKPCALPLGPALSTYLEYYLRHRPPDERRVFQNIETLEDACIPPVLFPHLMSARHTVANAYGVLENFDETVLEGWALLLRHTASVRRSHYTMWSRHHVHSRVLDHQVPFRIARLTPVPPDLLDDCAERLDRAWRVDVAVGPPAWPPPPPLATPIAPLPLCAECGTYPQFTHRRNEQYTASCRCERPNPIVRHSVSAETPLIQLATPLVDPLVLPTEYVGMSGGFVCVAPLSGEPTLYALRGPWCTAECQVVATAELDLDPAGLTVQGAQAEGYARMYWGNSRTAADMRRVWLSNTPQILCARHRADDHAIMAWALAESARNTRRYVRDDGVDAVDVVPAEPHGITTLVGIDVALRGTAICIRTAGHVTVHYWSTRAARVPRNRQDNWELVHHQSAHGPPPEQVLRVLDGIPQAHTLLGTEDAIRRVTSDGTPRSKVLGTQTDLTQFIHRLCLSRFPDAMLVDNRLVRKGRGADAAAARQALLEHEQTPRLVAPNEHPASDILDAYLITEYLTSLLAAVPAMDLRPP